ncbi:hypothetical protein CYLTODRAFT_223077 [Cylindrobasidium torrendii FP15055 ss-10]|uniref:Uncharacterized protein n=1 Tax=Cylindrobasidium torrendii FP15055 ss-10 TaxID=1314674 RepID=A0A0D7ATC2_9AGAR|nr:hypothetical protein CYLTODRAFT_223077 [Cylindrobasidium torrendii FP15055 ss-10]
MVDGNCQAFSSGRLCPICLEEPGIYGILECGHCFCAQCIQHWREARKPAIDMHILALSCPLCRKISRLIASSIIFYEQGDPRKEEIIAAEKNKLSEVVCLYAQRGDCPSGPECVYSHSDLNETSVVTTLERGDDIAEDAVAGNQGDIFLPIQDFSQGGYPRDVHLMVANLPRETRLTRRAILYMPGTQDT